MTLTATKAYPTGFYTAVNFTLKVDLKNTNILFTEFCESITYTFCQNKVEEYVIFSGLSRELEFKATKSVFKNKNSKVAYLLLASNIISVKAYNISEKHVARIIECLTSKYGKLHYTYFVKAVPKYVAPSTSEKGSKSRKSKPKSSKPE